MTIHKEIDAYSTAIVQNLELFQLWKQSYRSLLISEWLVQVEYLTAEYRKGKVTILFDGAMSNPQVYVNARSGHWLMIQLVFIWYNWFIKYKWEKRISVRLENKAQHPVVSGSRIVPECHLIITKDTHYTCLGNYITTPKITGEYAMVNIQNTIETKAQSSAIKVETEIFNSNGNQKLGVKIMDNYNDGILEQQLVVNILLCGHPKLLHSTRQYAKYMKR